MNSWDREWEQISALNLQSARRSFEAYCKEHPAARPNIEALIEEFLILMEEFEPEIAKPTPCRHEPDESANDLVAAHWGLAMEVMPSRRWYR